MAVSSYVTHEFREHLLKSTRISQVFSIKVMLPARRADESERFPVLYVTDADEFFGGHATMLNELQLVGETPRFILVGIGYDNPRASDLWRMRDLFTHNVRARFSGVIEQLCQTPMYADLADIEKITRTTDAVDFLNFIREELMPFVAVHYPVLPGENHYSGYSAGGTFGLYTLFTKPDTFDRYILGSPGTSYNGHHFGIELADNFVRSGRTLKNAVFMSAGELEEFYASFDLTSGYYLLAKFLKNVAIPGLDLRVRLFPGETHATAWTSAFIHGLKTLFDAPGGVPYWPDFHER